MPYALVATDERLFAGLADGELWESVDRGERWMRCEPRGDTLTELHARPPRRPSRLRPCPNSESG